MLGGLRVQSVNWVNMLHILRIDFVAVNVLRAGETYGKPV